MTRPKARDGEGHIMPNGYRRTMIGLVAQFDHIRLAEKAYGGPLPPGAIVHHVDEDKLRNVGGNLVICPDSAYHKLLHLRMNAMAAGHPPHWRKCRFCKQYDAPEQLFIRYSGVHHPECMNTYYRNKRGNP